MKTRFVWLLLSAFLGVLGFTGLPDAWLGSMGLSSGSFISTDAIQFILVFAAMTILVLINFERFKVYLFPNSLLVPLPTAGEALYKALLDTKFSALVSKVMTKGTEQRVEGARLILTKLDCNLWGKVGSSNKHIRLDSSIFANGILQKDAETYVCSDTVYRHLSISRNDLSRLIKNQIVSEPVIKSWEE